MWILFARAPRPDAIVWPGRRLLAAIDAIVWPAAVVWALLSVPGASGVAGPVLGAIAVLAAFPRLRRALWSNQRYRFTTWWVFRLLVVLLAIGFAMKLVLN